MDEENKNTGIRINPIGIYLNEATNTVEEANYEVPQFEETEKAEVIGKARKEHVKPQKLPAILTATTLTAIVIACIISGYILTKASIGELKRTLDVQQEEDETAGFSSNVSKCELLGKLENGKVFYTDDIVRPKVVTFLCNHGFHLFGDVTRTCQTDGDWDNTTPRCDHTSPVDCLDVLERGIGTTSGVYTVQLRKSNRTIDVMCDMTTDGGGWTVFQYRFSGDVDFYRTFAEYESGFGTLQGEFWHGLKNIYEMTELTRAEVYLEFTDKDGDIAIERFNGFNISAGPEYTLHLGLLIVMNDSSIGNNDFSYNNYQNFSTKDKDQDSSFSLDCAVLRHGGWWYNTCSNINPNGHYATPGTRSSYDDGWGGMINYAWKKEVSLKSTKLMFRRTP